MIGFNGNFAAMMKNFILLLTLATFVFAGCKKKEDPAPNPPKTGTLICKVNGKTWESSEVEATLDADTLVIAGTNESSNDTTFMVISATLNPNRVGTYSGDAVDGLYVGGASFFDFAIAIGGYTASSTLEITKFDPNAKKISGKYSITMTPKDANDPDTPPVSVSEGSFTDITFE